MLNKRIWTWLYQTATWLILVLLLITLPLLRLIKPKFAKWFRMRFWPEPVFFQPQLWFHAVSLGEVKVARSLIRYQAGQGFLDPQKLLVTTATQAGYHFLIDEFGRDHIRYLPWDTAFCYRRLFRNCKVPNLVVIETEIWPGLFSIVKQASQAVAIVNGRMSARTAKLRKNPLFRQTLSMVDLVAARDEVDCERYLQFGLPPAKVVVTGNIKFDFKPNSLKDETFLRWLNLPGPLIIFASIAGDEVGLLSRQAESLLALDEKPRILWAPRHLRNLKTHIQGLAKLKPGLRSHLHPNPDETERMLILDSFGELSACYSHAELSLIGGSFNARGGQNFLESLQAGTPAVMGPFSENFKAEVDEALKAGAILCLGSPADVAPTLATMLRNPNKLKEMSNRARDFLNKHTGAIARSTNLLVDLDILNKPPSEDT